MVLTIVLTAEGSALEAEGEVATRSGGKSFCDQHHSVRFWEMCLLTWIFAAMPGSSTRSSNWPCIVAKLKGSDENLCPSSSSRTPDLAIYSSSKNSFLIMSFEKVGLMPIWRVKAAFATGCSMRKTKVNSRGNPAACSSFSSLESGGISSCLVNNVWKAMRHEKNPFKHTRTKRVCYFLRRPLLLKILESSTLFQWLYSCRTQRWVWH